MCFLLCLYVRECCACMWESLYYSTREMHVQQNSIGRSVWNILKFGFVLHYVFCVYYVIFAFFVVAINAHSLLRMHGVITCSRNTADNSIVCGCENKAFWLSCSFSHRLTSQSLSIFYSNPLHIDLLLSHTPYFTIVKNHSYERKKRYQRKIRWRTENGWLAVDKTIAATKCNVIDSIAIEIEWNCFW